MSNNNVKIVDRDQGHLIAIDCDWSCCKYIIYNSSSFKVMISSHIIDSLSRKQIMCGIKHRGRCPKTWPAGWYGNCGRGP